MIDKNGFSRPTYDELVESLDVRWKQLFGENTQTNTHSVGGILIRIQAFFLNQLYQLAELVYNSQFIDSATGTTLDQLAANVGLTRSPSQVAIGTVKIWGSAGYIVPAGTLFRTADELEYITSEDIVLNDTGKHSLTIDGEEAPITDTETMVGYGESEFLYANGEGTTYNKGGENEAIQVTPTESILKVVLLEITGGADQETDENLRDRIDVANQVIAPSSPYNGVLSSIRKVAGVNSVRIVPNDTMVDDPKTNTPAKTVHIFVDGGYRQDVAQAIFDSLAAGVSTAGTEAVQINDIAGAPHVIRFDYPTTRAVYVSIQLTKNVDYPTNGDELIKQIVMSYVNSVGMGNTVYYSYLYKMIYDQVSGITVANITMGLTKDNLEAKDITFTDIETAAITSDRVMIS